MIAKLKRQVTDHSHVVVTPQQHAGIPRAGSCEGSPHERLSSKPPTVTTSEHHSTAPRSHRRDARRDARYQGHGATLSRCNDGRHGALRWRYVSVTQASRGRHGASRGVTGRHNVTVARGRPDTERHASSPLDGAVQSSTSSSIFT